MYQIVLFGFDEGAGDLINEVAGPNDCQRTIGLDEVFEVFAWDVFHYMVVEIRRIGPVAGDFAGVERPDDVGMLQLGDDADLVEEPRQQRAFLVGPGIKGQHLDRRQTPQVDMLRPEHHAHAAGAEAIEDAVAAKNQAVRGPRRDAIGLILRQQLGVDKALQQVLDHRLVLEALADRVGSALPIFAMDQRALDAKIEQRQRIARFDEARGRMAAVGFFVEGAHRDMSHFRRGIDRFKARRWRGPFQFCYCNRFHEGTIPYFWIPGQDWPNARLRLR